MTDKTDLPEAPVDYSTMKEKYTGYLVDAEFWEDSIEYFFCCPHDEDEWALYNNVLDDAKDTRNCGDIHWWSDADKNNYFRITFYIHT